jgi:hypothetical protein
LLRGQLSELIAGILLTLLVILLLYIINNNIIHKNVIGRQ